MGPDRRGPDRLRPDRLWAGLTWGRIGLGPERPDTELMTKIEEKCRNLLFQLHAKRIEVLDALNNK